MHKPSRAVRTHGKKANKSTRINRMQTRKLRRLEREATNGY